MTPRHLTPNTPPVAAGIVFRTGQTTTNSGAALSTLTLTLPSNPTAGDFIIVAVGVDFSSTTTVSSVASTNDTYVRAGSAATGANLDAEIWYAPNVVGGANSNSIVITPTIVATGMGAYAFEFSGVLASGPLDQHNTAASLTTATLTPGVANELFVAIAANFHVLTSAGTWTGFTALTGGSGHYGFGYLIASGSGTQSTTFGGTALDPQSNIASFQP